MYVRNQRLNASQETLFTAVIGDYGRLFEVVTDRAAVLAKAIGELAADALHVTV